LGKKQGIPAFSTSQIQSGKGFNIPVSEKIGKFLPEIKSVITHFRSIDKIKFFDVAVFHFRVPGR
jgi:hypothetical protein